LKSSEGSFRVLSFSSFEQKKKQLPAADFTDLRGSGKRGRKALQDLPGRQSGALRFS